MDSTSQSLAIILSIVLVLMIAAVMLFFCLRYRRRISVSDTEALTSTYDVRFGAPDISSPNMGAFVSSTPGKTQDDPFPENNMSKSSRKPLLLAPQISEYDLRAQRDYYDPSKPEKAYSSPLRNEFHLNAEDERPSPSYVTQTASSTNNPLTLTAHKAYISPGQIHRTQLQQPPSSEPSPNISPYTAIRHAPISPMTRAPSPLSPPPRSVSASPSPRIRKENISRPYSPAASTFSATSSTSQQHLSPTCYPSARGSSSSSSVVSSTTHAKSMSSASVHNSSPSAPAASWPTSAPHPPRSAPLPSDGGRRPLYLDLVLSSRNPLSSAPPAHARLTLQQQQQQQQRQQPLPTPTSSSSSSPPPPPPPRSASTPPRPTRGEEPPAGYQQRFLARRASRRGASKISSRFLGGAPPPSPQQPDTVREEIPAIAISGPMIRPEKRFAYDHDDGDDDDGHGGGGPQPPPVLLGKDRYVSMSGLVDGGDGERGTKGKGWNTGAGGGAGGKRTKKTAKETKRSGGGGGSRQRTRETEEGGGRLGDNDDDDVVHGEVRIALEKWRKRKVEGDGILMSPLSLF